MNNYKLRKTEFNVEYLGYNYLVVKITEDVNKVRDHRTLYFNDGDKAYNKFLDIVAKEEDMIRIKKNCAGYDTENIVEIDAVLTKEILDSYGTYDAVSGNIITQILFLRNPEVKAS